MYPMYFIIAKSIDPESFLLWASLELLCAFASLHITITALLGEALGQPCRSSRWLQSSSACGHWACASALQMYCIAFVTSSACCASLGVHRSKHTLKFVVHYVSCRLSLFVPDAANHGRWHVANLLLMSSELLRLTALAFSVRVRASGMESVSLTHVNSASSAAILRASGTWQAFWLAQVPGASEFECVVPCRASQGQWRGKRFAYPRHRRSLSAGPVACSEL